MRDHTLLQAIARVNRPYEEVGGIKKPAGFVLDFVGLFEKLEKALAFDSDVVSGVIQNLDVLKQHFSMLMREQAPPYLALCTGPVDDKAVERAIDAFADKEKRETFHAFFRQIEDLYEILSPDVFLRDYLEDYGKLSVLCQIMHNAFSKHVIPYADLARKTESLVRERVATYQLTTTMPLVTIDESTLEALKKSDSDPGKVINLSKSLIQTVTSESEQQPYLVPIGERAEAILDASDDRQTSTQQALRQLERLLQEYLQPKRERENTGFDLNTFTIYWVLKQAEVPGADKIAPSGNVALERFPHHAHNAAELRQLKAELYKVLLPVVGKERMGEWAEQLLRLKRP